MRIFKRGGGSGLEGFQLAGGAFVLKGNWLFLLKKTRPPIYQLPTVRGRRLTLLPSSIAPGIPSKSALLHLRAVFRCLRFSIGLSLSLSASLSLPPMISRSHCLTHIQINAQVSHLRRALICPKVRRVGLKRSCRAVTCGPQAWLMAATYAVCVLVAS